MTSNAATLTVNPAPVAPSITTQPASQTVTAGSDRYVLGDRDRHRSAQLSVAKERHRHQRRHFLELHHPCDDEFDNGALFTVVVTNSAGSVTSNAATLTVNLRRGAVDHHAAGQPDRHGGTDGDVLGDGTGTAPLSYQWQKNGAAISGATSVELHDAGDNDFGQRSTVHSRRDQLRGQRDQQRRYPHGESCRLSITTQPASQTVTAGQTATFTVTATGTAPLSYQWQKNGAAISGATSSSYTTPATTSRTMERCSRWS